MMIFTLFILIQYFIGCISGGSDLCHGDGCVAAAIEHLDWSYDDHICKEIKKIPCSMVQTLDNEEVCGTDDYTYSSHCEFAHARCFYILDHENYIHHVPIIVLDIKNYGPCADNTTMTTPVVTSNQVTPIVSGSMQSSTTSDVTSSTETITTVTPQSSTSTEETTSPGSSDVVTPLSTAPSTGSTTMSIEDLMAQVFCQNRGYIDCDTNFDIVCGSDGNLYPNICELSKAICNDFSLQQMDMSNCQP